MTSKPSINLWLDLWEELVEKGEAPDEKVFLDQYCRQAPPEMVEEFRKKLRRLNRMNARVDAAAASDTSSGAAGGTQNPAKTATPKILQSGFEPGNGYVLISELGSGGFGEVWKATGPGGHEVALKFVRLEKRMRNAELRALSVMRGVRHPHLMSCHASWQLGNWLIIAMDLADGTLLERLEEVNSKGLAGIPADELLGYMEEAAKGIDFLNEPRHPSPDGTLARIQHRDVKPENILLQGGSVKVADFGIAKLVEDTSTGHTGLKTIRYAAPESFEDRTTAQSDQYSLAATYCFLCTGRLPFSGTDHQMMKGHLYGEPDLSGLPESERPLVAQALAKNPADRWPNCRTFVNALRKVAERSTAALALPPHSAIAHEEARPTPPARVPAFPSPRPRAEVTLPSHKQPHTSLSGVVEQTVLPRGRGAKEDIGTNRTPTVGSSHEQSWLTRIGKSLTAAFTASPIRSNRDKWLDVVARTIILAAQVASDRGKLNETKYAVVRKIIASEAKRQAASGSSTPLGSDEIDAMIRNYTTITPSGGTSCDFRITSGMANRLIKRVWQVNVCDGQVTEAEIRYANELAERNRIDPLEYQLIYDCFHRHRSTMRVGDARRLLDVPTSATEEDIERSFAIKMAIKHPPEIDVTKGFYIEDLFVSDPTKLRDAGLLPQT